MDMESVAIKLKNGGGFWHDISDSSIVVSVGSENKLDIARISIDLYKSIKAYSRNVSWIIGSIHQGVRDYRHGISS